GSPGWSHQKYWTEISWKTTPFRGRAHARRRISVYSWVCKKKDWNLVLSRCRSYVEDRRKWDQITKRFDETRTKGIEKKGFKDHFARDDDGSYHPRDDSLYYSNQYMTVYVKNFGNSDVRQGREKYLYADYYEELP